MLMNQLTWRLPCRLSLQAERPVIDPTTGGILDVGNNDMSTSAIGGSDSGGGPVPVPVSPSNSGLRHSLWVVEESFGEESLHVRLERGLLSWQQVWP